MVDLVGLDAIGHLLEVRVMLQSRGEVVMVEEGSPMLGSLINHEHVVWIWLRVDARGVDGIMIVGESNQVGLFINSFIDELFLFLVGLEVAWV